MKTILIPSSIKTIGYSAFQGCSNLISVSFQEPSNLTTIASTIFGDVKNWTQFWFLLLLKQLVMAFLKNVQN